MLRAFCFFFSGPSFALSIKESERETGRLGDKKILWHFGLPIPIWHPATAADPRQPSFHRLSGSVRLVVWASLLVSPLFLEVAYAGAHWSPVVYSVLVHWRHPSTTSHSGQAGRLLKPVAAPVTFFSPSSSCSTYFLLHKIRISPTYPLVFRT